MKKNGSKDKCCSEQWLMSFTLSRSHLPSSLSLGNNTLSGGIIFPALLVALAEGVARYRVGWDVLRSETRNVSAQERRACGGYEGVWKQRDFTGSSGTLTWVGTGLISASYWEALWLQAGTSFLQSLTSSFIKVIIAVPQGYCMN